MNYLEQKMKFDHDYRNIPVMELHLRSMGEQMAIAFATHTDDMNKMVQAQLEKYLTVDHLQNLINLHAEKFVDDVIKLIFEDHALKRNIADSFVQQYIKGDLNE